MPAASKPSAPVVKLKPRTHARLQDIARGEKRPMGDVIADLLDRYDEERFWARVRQQIADLKADPDAWKDYMDETAAWDTLSGDGLEEEEPYYSPEEEREILGNAAKTQSR
jgi:hypothetical protein